MKQNIALVMGGFSGEHDISIASGNQVYTQLDHQRNNITRVVVERGGEWYALDADGHRLNVDRSDFSVNGQHFDLAFILIHGNPGENGVLQGYFDMLGIRYTTCGFYTSALTFHKGYCNAYVRQSGLVNVAQSVVLTPDNRPDSQFTIHNSQFTILNTPFTLPVFVKPAAGGSSVATTKVKRLEDLQPAIDEALSEADEVMVEQFIKGREFDCGVMRVAGQVKAFPVTEIIPTGGHEFFDFEAKYQGFSNEVTPAECPDALSDLIQQTSRRLYTYLNCRGIVRFDYIYDTDAAQLFFLEVNTIPGQSAESIVPKQARAMGITPAQLYQLAIDEAINGEL